MSNFKRVADWNARCGKTSYEVGTPDYYGALSAQALRIAEELKELQDAIQNQDLTEIVDAICDLEFVVNGAGVLANFDLDGAFGAVADNNDLKYTYDKGVAEIWAKAQTEPVTLEETTIDGTSTFCVKRVEDQKIMKPEGHPKVDLSGFVPTPVTYFMMVGSDDEAIKLGLESINLEGAPVYTAKSDLFKGENTKFISDAVEEAGKNVVLLTFVNGELQEMKSLED